MEVYKHNNEDYIFDNHKFSTEIPTNAKWLIVGTFPTLERNFEYNFYYSSRTNLFWDIMEEIFKYTFIHHKHEAAILERKEFLKKNGIGMTDMIEACFRKVNSSQDNSIIPIKLRDIFKILDEYKTIDNVILLSRTGIISAKGLFESLFLIDNKSIKFFRNKNGVLVGEFERGRKIRVLVPYSTSKSYHNNDSLKIKEVKKMFASCFEKTSNNVVKNE